MRKHPPRRQGQGPAHRFLPRTSTSVTPFPAISVDTVAGARTSSIQFGSRFSLSSGLLSVLAIAGGFTSCVCQ